MPHDVDRIPSEPLELLTTDATAVGVPGVVVVFDPDDAVDAGAFLETALTYEDARDAREDD